MAEEHVIHIPTWQKRLLAKRMAEFEADPTNVVTHAQFKAMVQKMKGNLRKARLRTPAS